LVAVPFANVAGTIQGENLSVDPVSGNVIVKNNIVRPDGSLHSTLGEWETKTRNVVHKAETDGFVMLSANSNVSPFWFQTGNNSNSLSNLNYVNSNGSWFYGSMTIPVRQGNYWKVPTTSGNLIVQWMPLGF
jgi:hypothetical protein